MIFFGIDNSIYSKPDMGIKAYLTAIRNPPPDLKATFDKEKEYLHSNIINTPANGTIFDFGCGAGRPMNALAMDSKYRIFHGIDINDTMIARALNGKRSGN